MVLIFVIMHFITMTTIPISYDSKTAYNFTTWCHYTSDYIYNSEQGGADWDVVYALTDNGAKKFTYEENDKVCFKPVTKRGKKYLHYSFVKIPEEAEVLVLNNLGAVFSASAGHKTNIKEIYVLNKKENFFLT